MTENNTTSELRALISCEEKRILNSFLSERRRGLMEISRSMDFIWTGLNMGFIQEPEQFDKISELFKFGISKAIHLFLDESCNFPSFPLGQSDKQSKDWADSVLMHCGRLGLCEHFLETNRIGLCELKKESDYIYQFQYSLSEPIGLESFERDDFIWYSQFVRQNQGNKIKELEVKKHKVLAIMANLVDTWENHFIQYEAHPDIDDFYEEIGMLHSQTMFGHDSFPKDTQFGGYEFDLYRKTVEILTGWTIKHVSFCTQLLKKKPHLNMLNIITVPQDFDDKAMFLSYQLNIDFETAKHLLQTLTLTYENKDVHCATRGDIVSPAFIQVGQGRVIFPIWNSNCDPFQFMLDELRRKYRSDWDRAVDKREDMFRQEIYSLFTGSRFCKVDKCINIKIGGSIVTDIDALILDRSTGVLAIFQLKWQDGFKNSMRERESKKRNLQKTGNQWVERIHYWLEGNSNSEICKLCRLDEEDIKRVNEFKVFVIARNAAHFSGIGHLDSRSAWGTWYQLFRIVKESITWTNPLDELYTLMIQESPLSKPPLKLPLEEFKIGDVSIMVAN